MKKHLSILILSVFLFSGCSIFFKMGNLKPAFNNLEVEIIGYKSSFYNEIELIVRLNTHDTALEKDLFFSTYYSITPTFDKENILLSGSIFPGVDFRKEDFENGYFSKEMSIQIPLDSLLLSEDDYVLNLQFINALLLLDANKQVSFSLKELLDERDYYEVIKKVTDIAVKRSMVKVNEEGLTISALALVNSSDKINKDKEINWQDFHLSVIVYQNGVAKSKSVSKQVYTREETVEFKIPFNKIDLPAGNYKLEYKIFANFYKQSKSNVIYQSSVVADIP